MILLSPLGKEAKGDPLRERRGDGAERRGDRDGAALGEKGVPPVAVAVADRHRRHPLARHPLARHPLARHPLARHPLARHPLARHPLARRPTA
ncbi:hypothetical protein ABTX62_12150 [Streptomyces sp. NPDC096046]|uniref:hypothetical protein n=1 Tax=Streptomyces sp. NPDC096046 TaxID=3155542 RepID=UPI00331F668F